MRRRMHSITRTVQVACVVILLSTAMSAFTSKLPMQRPTVRSIHPLIEEPHLFFPFSASRLNFMSSQRKHPATSSCNHDGVVFSASATTTDNEQSSLDNYKERRRYTTSSSSSSSTESSLPPPSEQQQHDSKRAKRKLIKSIFRSAKGMERQTRWRDASILYEKILRMDPYDSHSHLALARLEARREIKEQFQQEGSSHQYSSEQASPNSLDVVVGMATNGTNNNNNNDKSKSNMTVMYSAVKVANSKARMAFARGTKACPTNVHLKQAWAVFEESCGNIDRARELFLEALTLDERNSHACHAFGLMEKKLGNTDRARELFTQALQSQSTAALVCSLGEVLIANKEFKAARDLYIQHLLRLDNEKDKTEVYLASAWLEERYFGQYDRAQQLIELALAHSPSSGLAQVALARLEGRIQQRNRGGGVRNYDERLPQDATMKRLANACFNIEKGTTLVTNKHDGRLYNTWANMEVRSRRLSAARKILEKGCELYPLDQSLFHAAGKVEERVGNYTGARDLYGESLRIQPSAPTLVSFALLDLRLPHAQTPVNFTKVRGLFEEALLLDPHHGAAYNAYGNAEFNRGNVDEARAVFERGVRAECSDAASIYHGFGKLELSLGNVDTAREILEQGVREVRFNNVETDSPHRDRAKFLYHTLGTLELNSNRPTIALDTFLEGIERFGNSSQLLLGAALCNLKLGNEDKARALFEKSVLSDRKHAQAWQAWGNMETRAGNFKTATTLFKCGIKSAPTYGALWHAYALMEAKLGHIENARTLFAGGVKKANGYVALYHGWAYLELRNGNYQHAKTLIAEALTRDKRNGAGWLIAAQIEAELGNDGLQGLLLRRGIECAPNDPELYRTLGESLVNRGKIDDARQVLEKGIEINPLFAPLYHSLAELEARVFNLQGLAALNRRTSEVFNSNPLVPSKSSSQAWGKKIKAKRSAKLPDNVAALAQKIVDDNGVLGDDDAEGILDPVSTLDSIAANLIEDELLDDVFGVGSFSDNSL